ncbi:MAG: nucleotide exchange factor GrpE [Proteobacteria bacterium]|nr:nucleotide exchange factor GrpE [Pseudomonadota bacterium]
MDTQDVKNTEQTETDTSEEKVEVLSENEQTIAELKDQLLRALAENENTRKRAQKDKEDALKFGVSNIARDMVGVADNLRRAMENKSENAAELAEALFSGVDLILKDFEGVLGRHGIQRIDALNQQFDPHWHQAVFEQETEDHAPGIVIQVVQDGYKIHDRLLRPAMVAVSKAKKQGVA